MHKVKMIPAPTKTKTVEEWLERNKAAQRRSDEIRKKCAIIEESFK